MTRKFLITGPECSGKTTLAKALAREYKGVYLPEFARTYLEEHGSDYSRSDLDFILNGQLASEFAAVEAGASLIFCDTGPLNVKIWSEYKYDSVSQLILDSQVHLMSYASIFLCTPEMDWESDPLRENPNDRSELLKLFEKEMLKLNLDFHLISGNIADRIRRVRRIIDLNLKDKSMSKRDERIDAYIEKSEEFAKPILKYLRSCIHEANERIEENVRWGMPFFDYKGIICNIAAFKNHCSVGFWKVSLLEDPENVLHNAVDTGMGHFGKIQSLDDLPPKEIIIDLINQCIELNEKNIKTSPPAKNKKNELEIPFYLNEALQQSQKAKAFFEGLSYSHKKEYIEWLEEAKTEKTRVKRLATTIEWLEEGKSRNWKYR